MSWMHGTKEMWLGAMQTDGPALLASVTTAGPTVAVPSCPGWTVADLTHHLTGIYRFVTAHIVRGVTTPPERTRGRSSTSRRPPTCSVPGDEQFASCWRRWT